jgi:hypothetical protein
MPCRCATNAHVLFKLLAITGEDAKISVMADKLRTVTLISPLAHRPGPQQDTLILHGSVDIEQSPRTFWTASFRSSFGALLISCINLELSVEVKMRRNTKLLISILSFMQDNDKPTQCCKDIEKGAGTKEGHDWPEVRLHLALLKDMALVTECTTPAEYRLTSAGYDVIESLDPIEQIGMWAKLSSSNNTLSSPSFSAEKHPLPPAVRSQRFS